MAHSLILPYVLLALLAGIVGCSSSGSSSAPGGSTSSGSSAAAATTPKPEKPRTPIVLARLQKDPIDVAVDANAVYITEQDSSDPTVPTNIVRIPLDGGPPKVLAAKQRSAQSLVVAGNALFWIASGDVDRNVPDAVVKLPLTGGTPAKIGKTFVFGDAALVTDGAYLYFGDYKDGQGRLLKSLLDGTKVEAIASSGKDSISVLAVDSANAYWLSLGAILKAPLTGGPVTTLIDDVGVGNVWGLASDGSHLYFTDRNNFRSDDANTGAVRRVAVDGGRVETVAANLRGRPWGIALDDTHVYWVINAERGGGIMRIPKSGGLASVVVRDQASPVHLALDANYVYWANASGDRAVAKAPKVP